MSEGANVLRDADGLGALADVLGHASPAVPGDRPSFENAALTATANVVTAAARDRAESRGCHHRSDHPESEPARALSTIVRLDESGQPVVVAPTGACR